MDTWNMLMSRMIQQDCAINHLPLDWGHSKSLKGRWSLNDCD